MCLRHTVRPQDRFADAASTPVRDGSAGKEHEGLSDKERRARRLVFLFDSMLLIVCRPMVCRKVIFEDEKDVPEVQTNKNKMDWESNSRVSKHKPCGLQRQTLGVRKMP